MSALRAQLEMIANLRARSTTTFKFNGFESVVLTYGTLTNAAPSPTAAGVTVPLGARRDCYINSWRLATTDMSDTLLYTEGYAMAHGIAMEHAWLTHGPTGAVIDPTWGDIPNADPTEYLGIVFTSQFMSSWAHDTGRPSVLHSMHDDAIAILINGLEQSSEGRVTAIGEPLDGYE